MALFLRLSVHSTASLATKLNTELRGIIPDMYFFIELSVGKRILLHAANEAGFPNTSVNSNR